MSYTFRTNSPEETIALAERVGARLRRGDVIAFRGGLGAGKTTFTRGLAVGMGLPDEVISPTFTLVNEYRGGLTLFHFDMYRICGADDLETTGFYDYMDEDCVIAVEWSENIEGCLPKGAVTITLTRIDDDTREIEIDGDERFADAGN